MSTDDQMSARMFGGTTPSAQPAATLTTPDQDMAARLYGGTAPTQSTALYANSDHQALQQQAEPEADRPPRTEQEQADHLFGDKAAPVELEPVPDEVKALRDTTERRMFSAQQTLREAIPDATEPAEGFDLATTNKAMAEVREIAADLELGPTEVQQLRHRAELVRAAPPAEAEQVDAAIHALNTRFGNDAKQALRDARALLARDPRAAKVIENLGLGNDPHTVVMLAERARAQINAGKLKRART